MIRYFICWKFGTCHKLDQFIGLLVNNSDFVDILSVLLMAEHMIS